MAHSNRRATTELPPVFQPDSSGGPVVWRPLAESFNIVQTGKAPSGGFTVYKVVFKVRWWHVYGLCHFRHHRVALGVYDNNVQS